MPVGPERNRSDRSWPGCELSLMLLLCCGSGSWQSAANNPLGRVDLSDVLSCQLWRKTRIQHSDVICRRARHTSAKGYHRLPIYLCGSEVAAWPWWSDGVNSSEEVIWEVNTQESRSAPCPRSPQSNTGLSNTHLFYTTQKFCQFYKVKLFFTLFSAVRFV